MRNIYVGRQAIYDWKLTLYGYELLFRSGNQDTRPASDNFDGDRATSEVLLNTFMEIGLARIRAWTTLLALCRLDHKPQAHFTTALVRAHMCERLVRRQGGCPPETAFTVSLLSILDLLLDRTLGEIVDELALSEEIRTALLDHQGLAGRALGCTLAYESHQWEATEFECMPEWELAEIYLDASAQAFLEQQALQTVNQHP
jgi:c-di-GMP-related signal transduction protein